MEGLLRQSTAVIKKMGPFLDDTTGKDPETGLTIAQADIQLSKNGGAFAQTSDAAPTTTHDADGWYPIPFTVTDTGTLGDLDAQVYMVGALPVWRHFKVVPANVYDALVLGTDVLQAHVIEFTNDVITAAAIADNAIAAAKIATGAITNAKFAAGAIDAAAIAAAAIDIATFAADCKTGTYLNAQVKGQDNIDFGALQKASLNAATPASVVGAVGSVAGAVGSIGAGGVAAASFAAGAIDAAAIAADAIGASEFAQGAADKVWGTAARALTDKADFALSAASRAAIWDETEGITGAAHSFETILARLYRFFMNKMNITDATGAVALRNEADGADIATQTISDDDTTTVRTALGWS